MECSLCVVLKGVSSYGIERAVTGLGLLILAAGEDAASEGGFSVYCCFLAPRHSSVSAKWLGEDEVCDCYWRCG